MVIEYENLPIENQPLHVPPLEDIANALNKSLVSNFAEVSAEVVDCPDLTQQPFTLVSPGLGGRPSLVDVGGPPYLLPLVKREKVYDLRHFPKLLGFENSSATIVGAGAGPHPYVGVNCEGIINFKQIDETHVDQQTRVSKVVVEDGSFVEEQLPGDETRIALLGNFFVSKGEPGRVVKVHAKKRIGQDDFVTSIRKALQTKYGEDVVGLGGTFLIKEGKAKQHVMPDFSKTPLKTDEELNSWLKFYEMSAPLVAVGTLITGDLNLDLRVQHFHSFSHHGEAGHYHYDTTPDTVEYLGYFNVAERIYRIDRPVETHQVGRD